MIKSLSNVEEIIEYKQLEKKLEQNKDVEKLFNDKEKLRQKMIKLDERSTEYIELRKLYEDLSEKLYSNKDYVRFKILEREINMFVMYCNKEISKLFDLNKK